MTLPEVRTGPVVVNDEAGQSDHQGDWISADSAMPFATMAPILRGKNWEGTLPIPHGKKIPPPDGFTGHDGLDPSWPDVQCWLDNGEAGSNVALRLPDGVIGLDVDQYAINGRDKHGAATLAECVKNWGPLPATCIITSRDDGVSGIMLFRTPKALFWHALPGGDVDTITNYHRFVMMPPSLHPEGRTYALLDEHRQPLPLSAFPRPEDLPEMPERWVQELSRVREKHDQHADLGGQHAAWLSGLIGADGEQCVEMARVTKKATTIATGSRYEHMRKHSLSIVRLGEKGHHGTIAALHELRSAYVAVVGGDRSTSKVDSEFSRALAGACEIAVLQPSSPKPTRDPCEIDAWERSIRTDVVARAHPGSSVSVDLGATGDTFWAARPELASIQQWARARIVSPWAVLGVVLARVLTTVPPNVQLPAIVGGNASLNLFVGLVGASGSGKGGAEAVAADAVKLPHEIFSVSPGSGEGLVHQFARRGKDGQEAIRDAVLFTVAEVDTLAALSGRAGSTLLSQMRAAWSGEVLGHAFVDKDKAVRLERHSYRFCLLVGIQPLRAAPLLDDADGGTPQRVLWMPTTDPGAPDVPPDEPERLVLFDQKWAKQYSDVVLVVPPEVRQEIQRAQTANVRGENVDGSSGHLRLSRLKVAQALALLAGRRVMLVDDWLLAGTVIDVSERTRKAAAAALHDKAKRASRTRGELDGLAASAAAETTASHDEQRVARWLITWLGKNGPASRSAIHRAAPGRDRSNVISALDQLATLGLVTEIDKRWKLR